MTPYCSSSTMNLPYFAHPGVGVGDRFTLLLMKLPHTILSNRLTTTLGIPVCQIRYSHSKYSVEPL